MAKGAKKQQLQSQTTKQAAPPSYAQPYVNDILNRAQNASYQPYQPYGGNRIAGFTDAEKTARTGIMGLQAPTQFNTATEMATKAGNYTPGQFDGGYDQAQFTGGNYGTGQFDDAYDQAKFTGGDYGTGQFDGGYDATQFTGGDYGTGQFDNTYNPTQFTGGDYATGQFNGGYDPTKFTGGNYGAGQFNTNSFNDSGMASQYMSPYMQNVVDVQKQSAVRDAKQGQLAGNLGAARQGTYGGSRQLLANMERERNLGTQLGSIQATGSQAAYDAAQKQFGSEQDRRMQAQQYGEQSRQFGGSQSMEAQRQAEQSRQFGSSQGMDAQRQAEQSRQFGSSRQLQAQEAQDRANQFGANFGMDAQKQREASRQFGSTRQLQAQQEQERAKQFGANFGMDAQKQREQSRQYGADQRSRAEESAARERQFGANYRMDAQKQREQSRQYGADQRSRAEEAAARERQFGANYRMDARKLGEDSRQFGARQGLDAANQLNQLGTSQQDSDLRRYGAMSAVGEGERDLRQRGLDMQYGDFKDQRDYEKNQLRDYSAIVGAQPQGNMTENVYGKDPSALAGLAGTAAAAYGGYKTFAGAAGGEIRSYNNGGLVALAEGGGVSGDEDSVFKLKNDPKELLYSTMGDPAKLQALAQQGADPTAIGIAAMLAKRIHDTQSMAMAPQQTTVDGLLNPQPQQPQPQGQPQGQQGLAGIAPQGQPPMDPMQGQPPMDPMQGPPPMDPMQAQGLEALAQQDQPMEEQPMEEQPMMAANGGLMNINLPDDYYDEDSYAHGGIAHFAAGGFGETYATVKKRLADTYEKAKRMYEEDGSPAAQKLLNKVGEISGAMGEGLSSDFSTMGTAAKLAAGIAGSPAAVAIRGASKLGKTLGAGADKLAENDPNRTGFQQTIAGIPKSVKDAPGNVFDYAKSLVSPDFVDYFTKTQQEVADATRVADQRNAALDQEDKDDAYTNSKGNLYTPTKVADLTAPKPPAPKGLAQLQEIDKSTIPARTPEKVDYMAKAKELYAGVPSSGMTDEEMAKDKEQRKYEALMQFGLNLAGTKNSSFLGGVGEAGAATMPAIIEARTSQNEAKAARRKEDRDMKVAQIQTALGLEKDDAEKVFKQQELELLKKKVELEGRPSNLIELFQTNPAEAIKLIGMQTEGKGGMTESQAARMATIMAQSNPDFPDMPPETQMNYIQDIMRSLMVGVGGGSQGTPKGTQVGGYFVDEVTQ